MGHSGYAFKQCSDTIPLVVLWLRCYIAQSTLLGIIRLLCSGSNRLWFDAIQVHICKVELQPFGPGIHPAKRGRVPD